MPLFAGVGPALIQKRVPAVIAMQYPVRKDTAGAFSSQLYKALADDSPIDLAVNEARKFLSSDGRWSDSRDWSTPVLYMATRSGQIFSLQREDPVEAAVRTIRSDRTLAPYVGRGMAVASARLTDLVARANQIRRWRDVMERVDAFKSAISGQPAFYS
jgi:hypothetical protein